MASQIALCVCSALPDVHVVPQSSFSSNESDSDALGVVFGCILAFFGCRLKSGGLNEQLGHFKD